MYDLVGEERFLASTLANRMSQAKLYVGVRGENATDTPEESENEEVSGLLSAIGNSASARQQLLQRLGVNLFMAGDGWLVGIPRHMMPNGDDRPDPHALVDQSDSGDLLIEDLEWRMLSVTELTSNAAGQVSIKLGDSAGETITCTPDEVYLIRVWRPHPRRWWEADSPTRSSLPVLRELVGLTMHISAQVDSRLAGAGLLIVPQSAQRALAAAAGMDENDTTDQFTEALMEAMLQPISDRSNASALVPLVVTVPDEVTSSFNFITFAKPLDTESRNLREEAIRRLALGQDAPPELLLGTAGMNHWGAWLVQEDVVTTHLEPPLALICDALTTQYLWPVLIEQGMERETAEQFVVWYDVSDLVVRPNKSQDALVLFDRGLLSDRAVRTATGFDEADAPEVPDDLPAEVKLALELAHANPSLFASPGLTQVVAQLRAVMSGENLAPPASTDAPAAPAGVDEPGGDRVPGIPDTQGDPAQAPPPGPGLRSILSGSDVLTEAEWALDGQFRG